MTQEFDLGYIRGAAGPAGPQGPAGSQGPAGPAGATPSISIGRVSAVGAGQTPYVSRREGSPDIAPILDFGLPGSGGDMLSATYDPDRRHQDVFAYCDARSGRRAATVVVAAADSQDRSRADFLCDGLSDQITINQALAALPAGGGQVLLLEGSYYLDCLGAAPDLFGDRSLISVNGDNISICGQGRSTRLSLAGAAASSGGVFLLSVKGAGFYAAGFTLDGNSSENDGADIYGLMLASSAPDAYLTRLLAQNCSASGFGSLGEDAAIIACTARGCGVGLALSGGRAQVRACCFSGNGQGASINGGQHILSECCFYDNSLCGLSGSGGGRCRICNNTLWGQPLGISLTAAADCLISGNLILRSAAASAWGADEYPLKLSGCLRPHAVNNYVYGKAVAVENCSGAQLSYSGSDWNPTA